MIFLAFCGVLVILGLLWLLKHLVYFYKGILKEPDVTNRLLSLFKVLVPLAIAGVLAQIFFITTFIFKMIFQ